MTWACTVDRQGPQNGHKQSSGIGDESVSHLNSFGLNMLNNSSSRPKRPSRRADRPPASAESPSFENPAWTCPAVARAVHQLVPCSRDVRLRDPGGPGLTDASRSSFSVTGGTSVAPDHW